VPRNEVGQPTREEDIARLKKEEEERSKSELKSYDLKLCNELF
jgi:hypothetical protein